MRLRHRAYILCSAWDESVSALGVRGKDHHEKGTRIYQENFIQQCLRGSGGIGNFKKKSDMFRGQTAV